MHLFGLTGGIASGKSTVGAHLRSRGVPVIDADELAREVVAPGTDGLQEVVGVFGREVLHPSGELDRQALGRRVFADPAALGRLNAIVHPRVAALTAARSADLAAARQPLACYEAALLVENGLAEAFRPLVVCACSEEQQMSRLLARGGMSHKEALSRIRSQRPLADKVALADHVIDTSGTLGQTEARTDDVFRAVCAGLGVEAARYGYVPSTSP